MHGRAGCNITATSVCTWPWAVTSRSSPARNGLLARVQVHAGWRRKIIEKQDEDRKEEGKAGEKDEEKGEGGGDDKERGGG